MSLAIFISATATPRSPADARTAASSEPCAMNLFAAVTNGLPVNSAIFAATATLKPLGALRPVPTAVPPSASSYSPARLASTAEMAARICAA